MEEALKTAIQGGFTSVAGMVKDIVLLGVPATIGIVGLTAGAKYGIKWVKGMMDRAS